MHTPRFRPVSIPGCWPVHHLVKASQLILTRSQGEGPCVVGKQEAKAAAPQAAGVRSSSCVGQASLSGTSVLSEDGVNVCACSNLRSEQRGGRFFTERALTSPHGGLAAREFRRRYPPPLTDSKWWSFRQRRHNLRLNEKRKLFK